jgi:hypothetical protein
MEIFTIPTAVVLLMCIGVGDGGWPTSARTIQTMRASFVFTKRALSSASAAEAATIFKIAYVTATLPLSWIRLLL